MTRCLRCLVVVCGFALAVLTSVAGAAKDARPTRDYLLLVASEATDQVAVVRYGPSGIKVERERYVGWSQSELVGPHGVAISPDGMSYYVTLAHGNPEGYLQRFNTLTGAYEGGVQLGMFPATAQVSPDGHYIYVANFDLWGEPLPSSISMVGTASMAEIARVETCIMPHGSRFTSDGRKHYSACMMNDMLIEIDTRTMEVSRHFVVAAGKERGGAGHPPFSRAAHVQHSGGTAHSMEPPKPGDGSCEPTWAQPDGTGKRIWIACNRSSEIVEIDGASWSMTRRIRAAPGVYNLALSHDERLLIGTNRRDQSVSIFDAATGRELKRVPTTRKMLHGAVVSDDDRYAFITMEGSNREPGSMDVFDLRSFAKMASIDLGAQAGGIDFWKSEDSATRTIVPRPPERPR
jgi:DNA-binding beta-propeller fold protein YncE